MGTKSFLNVIRVVSGFGLKKLLILVSARILHWLLLVSFFLSSCSYQTDKFVFFYEDAVKIQAELFHKEHQITDVCFYISELEKIDQGMRLNPSSLSESFVRKVRYIDEINEMSLKNILKSFRFKDLKKHDDKCYHNAWLIVQHSKDHHFQKRILKDINKNTEKYALLYDRVQINSGLSQKYGTQFDYDNKTGEVTLKPLQSLKKLNQYRKECGLEPIQDYLKKSKELMMVR
jgi:hypothetical protein